MIFTVDKKAAMLMYTNIYSVDIYIVTYDWRQLIARLQGYRQLLILFAIILRRTCKYLDVSLQLNFTILNEDNNMHSDTRETYHKITGFINTVIKVKIFYFLFQHISFFILYAKLLTVYLTIDLQIFYKDYCK